MWERMWHPKILMVPLTLCPHCQHVHPGAPKHRGISRELKGSGAAPTPSLHPSLPARSTPTSTFLQLKSIYSFKILLVSAACSAFSRI